MGVLALLAAAGFFLKHAFERGWISPELRVAGGIAAGLAIALGGERLVARGLRAYGAALIGAGGGLAYLAAWAAAAPYGLLSKPIGTGLLFALTAAVGLRAAHHQIEGLTVWALLGAYLAPIFLPQPSARPEWLWAYLALVGGTAGWVAARHAWRVAMDTALLGYFLLPVGFNGDALVSPAGMLYAAVGGVAGQLATAGRGWAEARIGGLGLAWWVVFLGAGGSGDRERWAALAAGAALTLVSWWQARGESLAAAPGRSLPLSEGDAAFLVSPLALTLLAGTSRPTTLVEWGGAVPAAAGLLYLASGWPGRRSHLVGMGFGLLGLAVSSQWDGLSVALGWTLLALCAVAAARWAGQRAGVPLGLVLGTLGWLALFIGGQTDRAAADPAFTGVWSLAWYVGTLGLALAARWLPAAGATLLWALVGAGVFFGGTIELQRFFSARAAAWPNAELAGDLATSAFWIGYAGLLVWLGFQLARKTVRTAGLGVAGLAVLKIALYDLANLEALYRVGSVFALALIALAGAYAYNRRASSESV